MAASKMDAVAAADIVAAGAADPAADTLGAWLRLLPIPVCIEIAALIPEVCENGFKAAKAWQQSTLLVYPACPRAAPIISKVLNNTNATQVDIDAELTVLLSMACQPMRATTGKERPVNTVHCHLFYTIALLEIVRHI